MSAKPHIPPRPHGFSFFCLRAILLLATICSGVAAGTADETKQPWTATLRVGRSVILASKADGSRKDALARDIWRGFQNQHPVAWDWLLQDGGRDFFVYLPKTDEREVLRRLLRSVAKEIPAEAKTLQEKIDAHLADKSTLSAEAGLEMYAQACEMRRARRLELAVRAAPKIVFTKHHTLRPSFFGYTEGQSDAQNERHFLPDSALCVLDLANPSAGAETLLKDPTGAIRDPAVSWDGQRILFAWKKSLDEDDYHLYEFDLQTRKIVQITSGLGFADYEGAYLPNGDLVFSSTRCVQTVDCWWTEVSNLYTCDGQGRYMRRLGFDQVHAIHPTVTEDGRVLYTRWDYNDRGQVFPQALFQMNPDGTGQAEFYGNNSWFPTTIAHARGIPGTSKVLATFCGHHTAQAGKLGVIDPSKGRQENTGAKLVAPIRETPAVRIDAYGQEGELFQYPYPLHENEFLVTYAPLGWEWRGGHFGVYWMDMNGRRELLASDSHFPCSQSIPLVSRKPPALRPSKVDYAAKTGTCYIQDIYTGQSLKGVPRGSVKRLRVVALEYRAAGVGHNSNGGPAGGALISTPIAVGNGCWDVKVVLGETPIQEDGSASFLVPARTPVYFQALDEKGQVIQTMRSWTTLQPGEIQSCVGCHEDKNAAPPSSISYAAARLAPRELEPFYGVARGFSYPREIQPILDQHCVRCHNQDPAQAASPAVQTADSSVMKVKPAFGLRANPVHDRTAARFWSESYLTLTGCREKGLAWDLEVYTGKPDRELVNWVSSQSVPELLPPYSAGAARSKLIRMLTEGHQGVQLAEADLRKLTCWIDLGVPFCGDYTEANAWSEEDRQKYARFEAKRKAMEEAEQRSIRALIGQSR
jgi:hypothetical protein